MNRYLQTTFPNTPEAKRVAELAPIANGNDIKYYDEVLAILKSLKAIPPVKKTPPKLDPDILLKLICRNFHRFTNTISTRYDGRPPLVIKDEYDVQDILEAILRIFFDDVRREDNNPSHAGRNTRADFSLPDYDIFIETKMTRPSLKDKEIGDELLQDIGRYRDYCKKLVCFIYDKNSYLANPHGIIKDLETHSTDEMQVKVYIAP